MIIPILDRLFLASVFRLIGYPESLNPSPGNEQSIEMLYLVPRILMGLLAVGDTFLVYKIAERRYNRKVAFVAAILFAVMPMTWFARRILLDSIGLPLILLSILFAIYAKTGTKNIDKNIGVANDPNTSHCTSYAFRYLSWISYLYQTTCSHYDSVSRISYLCKY